MQLRWRWLTPWLVCFAVLVAASGEAQECSPTDPNLLLPDLVAETPSGVRALDVQGHRIVIFNTVIGNVGDGPLIVQGQTVATPSGTKTQATQIVWRRDGTSCTHLAGYFEYHPSHHHFHIDDFASYQLRQADPFTGPIVAESSKVSFCLLDVLQLRGFHNPRQVLSDCLNPNGVQGISVGYADEYNSFLPGQFIDLDADPAHPVPPGNYFVVNIANPDGELLEKSMDNNTGVASVRVPSSFGFPTPAASPGPPVPPTPGTTHGSLPHAVHSPSPPHSPRPLPHPHAPHRPPHLHVTIHPTLPGQPST